jgi:hypothetical protein
MSELRLKSSRLLLMMIGLIFGLAVLALYWSPLQWPLALPLVLTLFLALGNCLQLLRLQDSRLWLGSESCRLTDSKGSRRFYPPRPDYLGEFLIILSLTPYPEQAQPEAKPTCLTHLWRDRSAEKLLIPGGSLSAKGDWQLRRYLQRCLEQQRSLAGM